MTQSLFIEPAAYIEKRSSETELPEDPNAWPTEILQELYKQVPYIADFEPHVQMDRADGEKGYGFGHVQISNKTEAQQGSSPEQMQSAGIREVRIPVVIREGKLQPFDILVTDNSKMLPLTEARLRQAIFRPQAFDVTARTPGDQSMIGQLYPPYRQNYGFGGGGIAMDAGMGKQSSALEQFLEAAAPKEKNAAAIDDYMAGEHRHGRLGKKSVTMDAKEGALSDFVAKHAAAKTGSLLRDILPTINVSDYAVFSDSLRAPGMQAAFVKNASAGSEAIKTLLEFEPADAAKTASAMLGAVRPDVVQLARVGDGRYSIKTANHRFWDPRVRVVGRAELVREFGEKIALATDTEGAVTMSDGGGASEAPAPEPDVEQPGPVTACGMYKVQDDQGREHLGAVIPNLLDVDGTQLPLALFTNGSVQAVQADVVGKPAGKIKDLPTSDEPEGHGFFFKVEGHDVHATIPLILKSSTSMPGEPTDSQAETFDGRPVELSVQPNIQTVMATPDGKMLVPADWKWSPLDSAEPVALVSAEQDVGKEAAARRKIASVEVRAAGADCFSLSGMVIDKLAHEQREMIGIDDAMFLLAGLGVDQSYGVRKLGEAYSGREPVTVRIGRTITLANDEKVAAFRRALERQIPDLKRPLFKEAAYIPDPTAVDTVLSIGFVNPENIMTFVSYLPEIEHAQERMCELLMAARLGLREIPASALEKAIRSTEEVLEGLKVMAFTD